MKLNALVITSKKLRWNIEKLNFFLRKNKLLKSIFVTLKKIRYYKIKLTAKFYPKTQLIKSISRDPDLFSIFSSEAISSSGKPELIEKLAHIQARFPGSAKYDRKKKIKINRALSKLLEVGLLTNDGTICSCAIACLFRNREFNHKHIKIIIDKNPNWQKNIPLTNRSAFLYIVHFFSSNLNFFDYDNINKILELFRILKNRNSEELSRAFPIFNYFLSKFHDNFEKQDLRNLILFLHDGLQGIENKKFINKYTKFDKSLIFSNSNIEEIILSNLKISRSLVYGSADFVPNVDYLYTSEAVSDIQCMSKVIHDFINYELKASQVRPYFHSEILRYMFNRHRASYFSLKRIQKLSSAGCIDKITLINQEHSARNAIDSFLLFLLSTSYLNLNFNVNHFYLTPADIKALSDDLEKGQFKIHEKQKEISHNSDFEEIYVPKKPVNKTVYIITSSQKDRSIKFTRSILKNRLAKGYRCVLVLTNFDTDSPDMALKKFGVKCVLPADRLVIVSLFNSAVNKVRLRSHGNLFKKICILGLLKKPKNVLDAYLSLVIKSEIKLLIDYLKGSEEVLYEGIDASIIRNQKNIVVNLVPNTFANDLIVYLFKEKNIKVCDIYSVTIGNNAGQFKSSADFISVIDTTQKSFISKYWNVEPKYIITSGYLTSEISDFNFFSHKVENFFENYCNVLVATQPNVVETNLEMLACVGQTLVGLSGLTIGIRLHPREDKDNFYIYKAVLTKAGIASHRIHLDNGALDAAFSRYGIFITQTSNVALQAAANGCIVIKYLAAQNFVDKEVTNTQYSLNVFEKNNFEAEFLNLYQNEEARQRLRDNVVAYLKSNPNLNGPEGIDNLFDKLEQFTVED